MRRSLLALLPLLAACGDGPAVSITSLGGITTNADGACEANMSAPASLAWDVAMGAPYFVGLTLQNDGDEPAELTELTIEVDNQGYWESLDAKRVAKLSTTVEPNGGTSTVLVELLDAALAEELSAKGGILEGVWSGGNIRLRVSADEAGTPYEITLGICNGCLASDANMPEFGRCRPGVTLPVGCALAQFDGYACEP